MTKKPKWVPDDGGDQFTTSVMDGIESKHDGMDKTSIKKHIVKKKKT